MKRLIAACSLLSLSTVLLVGCAEKKKTERTETVSSPGGTTETTISKEVKSTGDNPPPNTQGETGK